MCPLPTRKRRLKLLPRPRSLTERMRSPLPPLKARPPSKAKEAPAEQQTEITKAAWSGLAVAGDLMKQADVE